MVDHPHQTAKEGVFSDGDSVPMPLRFSAFQPEWSRFRGGSRRPAPFRRLARRSGRIPALPYPPAKCVQRISSAMDPFCRYYGPEMTSRHYLAWCIEQKIAAVHIQPGRPMQNGHVESFNGRLRDECLNTSWFANLWDARWKITVTSAHLRVPNILA
jgi:transposase InsO family protein